MGFANRYIRKNWSNIIKKQYGDILEFRKHFLEDINNNSIDNPKEHCLEKLNYFKELLEEEKLKDNNNDMICQNIFTIGVMVSTYEKALKVLKERQSAMIIEEDVKESKGWKYKKLVFKI